MIVLVIPCYNEENRLKLNEFAKYANQELQFVFVDDGSKDNTKKIIEEAARQNPYLHLHSMPKNGGKAAAVRGGFLAVPSKFQLTAKDWVGFWDADLATPLSEVEKMLRYGETYGEVDSLWASRIYRLGSHIERSALRHYLGRGFATVISILLKVKSYDSQCGAKLFKASLIQKAFEESFTSNWVFDVEILLRLHDKKIVEYPVTEWRDIPGSKVKVFREMGRVFMDILKIRKRYLED